jgi:hypothetical protein
MRKQQFASNMSIAMKRKWAERRELKGRVMGENRLSRDVVGDDGGPDQRRKDRTARG